MKWFKKDEGTEQQVNGNEQKADSTSTDTESPELCVNNESVSEKTETTLGGDDTLVQKELAQLSDRSPAINVESFSTNEGVTETEVTPDDQTEIESTLPVNNYSNSVRLKERFDEQKALLEKILSEFSLKLKYDEKKQEQIDQLYSENLAFREGLVEKFKTKLIQAVIEQIDDSEPGTAFDPRNQRTLRTTPTCDVEKVKTLRGSIRYGYKNYDGQLIRPELVDVYVIDKKSTVKEEEKFNNTPEPSSDLSTGKAE